MHYARYLTLLILFSAVASSAAVSSVYDADGYQSSTDSVHALVHTQEHDGDQPEAVLSKPLANREIFRALCIGEPQRKATLNAYSDYHCRAPPQLL